MEGTVTAIWIKRAHRGPMDPADRVTLRAGHGIVGSADRSRYRQVTLVDQALWDAIVAPLGVPVNPIVRRANFLISGLDLAGSRGRILRMGSCRLRINGETRP